MPAIIPAPGNLYTHPVPAWIHVGNGYGKLIGETQVREFGEIETPILLTCTLCVWSAANALKEWVYEQPGMGEHTVNPVVGETNDANVNNMWADPIQRDEVFAALEAAIVSARARLIFVSNEVGLGIVPENRMAREFRDHAGRLHQRIAAIAGEVYFVAAGLPLKMKG